LRKDVIDCINQLLDMGYYVTTCSGRSYKGSMRFLSQFKSGKKFAICANGAMIYKESGELLDYKPVKYKDYLKVFNLMKDEKDFFTYFYSKDCLYHIYYDECIELDKTSSRMDSYNVENKFKDDDLIEKIMVRDKTKEKMKFYKAPFILKFKYQAVKSSKVFLEVTNKKATKGNGVEVLRKQLGVDKNEVYVFGDSGNDLSMIKKFKNSVAMGNGMDKIKKAATYVTIHVKDGGVPHALKEILKIL
jgi:Cof subfamily protein (haloacid dehalogenase superfamily)